MTAVDDEMEVEVERVGEGERSGRKVYQGLLQAGGGGKEMYSPEDLDVLALYFAVVKVWCGVRVLVAVVVVVVTVVVAVVGSFFWP